MNQQVRFWVEAPKNWKQGLAQLFARSCSQWRYSQGPKLGGSRASSVGEGISCPWSALTRDLSALKGKEILEMLQPGWTWGQCAKRNKLGTKRQILYESLRVVKGREDGGGCQRLGEGRMGCYCFTSIEFQFYKWKSYGDGPRRWSHSMSCTVKND